MSIGMSWEDFWHGDPSSHRAYIKASKLRLERENAMQWRAGMYMQLAIGQVFSKQRVYPNEPLPMDEQAKEEHEVLKNAESIATVMNDMLRGAIHGTTTEDSDNS